jgi:hypothetical protein
MRRPAQAPSACPARSRRPWLLHPQRIRSTHRPAGQTRSQRREHVSRRWEPRMFVPRNAWLRTATPRTSQPWFPTAAEVPQRRRWAALLDVWLRRAGHIPEARFPLAAGPGSLPARRRRKAANLAGHPRACLGSAARCSAPQIPEAITPIAASPSRRFRGGRDARNRAAPGRAPPCGPTSGTSNHRGDPRRRTNRWNDTAPRLAPHFAALRITASVRSAGLVPATPPGAAPSRWARPCRAERITGASARPVRVARMSRARSDRRTGEGT